MKTWEKIVSQNESTQAEGITEFFKRADVSRSKEFARTGVDYYNAEHDILGTRILYLDDHDRLVEDPYASNNMIPHPFFIELVDQKVQYLLSNDVEFKTEDENLEARLAEYIDDDFQLFLDELVEGASIKGAEYAYARTDANDKLKFEIADYINTHSIYNDFNEEVAVVHKYSEKILKDGKEVTLTHAEIYTEEEVAFFIAEDGKPFDLDDTIEPNPREHIVAFDAEGNTLERNYGTIPFHKLKNNRAEASDLKPIKRLIDDYDIMSSALSNNLQDYDKPFFVVKGYQGESMDKIRQNLKAKGGIKVGAPNSGGDLEIRTYQIPFEARKVKMELDEKSIYKFGMGFDSSQEGSANITNVEIKSRYQLLDFKCNKIETRLRSLLLWSLELILNDIKRVYGEEYDIKEIEVEIERSGVFNEKDEAQKENIIVGMKRQKLNAILDVAGRLDDETILELICDVLELSVEEVQTRLGEQDYKPFLQNVLSQLEQPSGTRLPAPGANAPTAPVPTPGVVADDE